MPKFSSNVVNGMLGVLRTELGANPLLKLFTGAPPVNVAAADSGTLLVNMTLPAAPLSTPAAGSMSKAGVWSGTAAASGTIGYARFYSAAGACVAQASVSPAGGAGEIVSNLTHASVNTGQAISIDGAVFDLLVNL